MDNWKKISLFKFQEIEEINCTDEMDKILFTVCKVFGYTEHELNNINPKKAVRLINRVNKIFSSDFKPTPKNWIGKFRVEYNPANLTFGQYVELSFFLQSKNKAGENDAHIRHGHYILASISKCPFKKYSHRQRAEYFLTVPIEIVIGSIMKFLQNFADFNKEYSSLFGLSSETDEEVKQDKFNKRYGWTYSASQVAEYERITLDQAYSLPVRQALGDLAYLKEKASYDEQLLKKK